MIQTTFPLSARARLRPFLRAYRDSNRSQSDSKTHTSLFEVVGELGVSGERVAKRCAGRVRKFIHSQAAVEEQLADQLLIPMVLAGGGSYTTSKPTLHTTTNIEVIRQFVDTSISVKQYNETGWKITLG